MKTALLIPLLLLPFLTFSQQTPFERSLGKETATYFEAIDYYKKIDQLSGKVVMKEMGATDAGYPLHLILISNDGKFAPVEWHRNNKVVILINNGIHPGEPDGIDASMMLVRDIATNKIKLPDNVAIGLIPVYNIGGSLNRSGFSRVNQNGPLQYGFRGNSQNLDLNRDFTKSDSKEARSFAAIFHFLDPDILVDNHVSDGADYQYTMTLLATQYDKLGATLGTWLKEKFEPGLYAAMSKKGWEMSPYVNFETAPVDSGMIQFYDAPMYSSGYAALFQTIAFMPETHMLKPFSDRVRATYALMQTFIEQAGMQAGQLISVRTRAIAESIKQKAIPLKWLPDSTKYSLIPFNGYEQAVKTSDATGLPRMYYDHNKPFHRQVKYFNVFSPHKVVSKPKAYVVPQGWWKVTELLKLNGVSITPLERDTVIEVEAYHISDYKPLVTPFETHHKNTQVTTSASLQKIKFLKGDYIIPLGQRVDRYIVEMLEPSGDDSFFAWNFFDAILQQKEHYSDYRWEDTAAAVLRNNPELRQTLAAKKKNDSSFSKNSAAQLNFIYKNSPYYEPAHLRYPVYRLLK
jgi:hypothetical protein